MCRPVRIRQPADIPDSVLLPRYVFLPQPVRPRRPYDYKGRGGGPPPRDARQCACQQLCLLFARARGVPCRNTRCWFPNKRRRLTHRRLRTIQWPRMPQMLIFSFYSSYLVEDIVVQKCAVSTLNKVETYMLNRLTFIYYCYKIHPACKSLCACRNGENDKLSQMEQHHD